MDASFTTLWRLLFVGVVLVGISAAAPQTRTMRYTSRPAPLAEAWQAQLRSKLFDLLKLSDRLPGRKAIALDPHTKSTTTSHGYTSYEITVRTTPARHMDVVLTVPTAGAGPFPALVLIAGHTGTRHTCYEDAHGYHRIGQVLAQQGYVTVSTEISRHTVREEGQTLVGERLWDLMRCIDFLESRPEVDARRIGCVGKSLGGEMTTWLSAMDPRIRACVVAGFLTDMDQMEHDHCMCWKAAGLRDLVDWADIFSLIAPRPLQCQNGLEEPASQFPPARALPVLKEIGIIYADEKAPQNVTMLVHPGGHEFNVPAVLSFFAKTLGDAPRPH